ncbi:MAG: hydrolase [Calditrichaeota bacterium]|nr:MAG: hydrolase [Calditrichota bacterium]
MRIKRENTAAVVVDIQERLFPHIHENEPLLKNVVTLIQGLQLLRVPLLVTEQYPRGLGRTLPELAAVLGAFEPIEKIAFSCCGENNFQSALEKLGRKTVILMGIEAHVCILQTSLDLLELGYRPVVIADCVSSRKPGDKSIALQRLQAEGALLSSYESILFELCGIAGTEEFKAISRLVK